MWFSACSVKQLHEISTSGTFLDNQYAFTLPHNMVQKNCGQNVHPAKYVRSFNFRHPNTKIISIGLIRETMYT